MVATLDQAMTHDKHYSKAWIITINWRILFSYAHIDIYIDRKWKNLHAFAQRRKNRYRKLKMMLQTIKVQLSQEHKCYEYMCFLVLIIERVISECTCLEARKKKKKPSQSTMHTVISIQAYGDTGVQMVVVRRKPQALQTEKFHKLKKENLFNCNYSGKLGIQYLF